MKANVSSLFLLVTLFNHLYTLLAAFDSGRAQALLRTQRNRRGLVTDDENVVLTGKEGLFLVIYEVDHSICAGVLDNLGDASDSAGGSSANNASKLFFNEGEMLNDLSSLQVDLDGVVCLDLGVGKSDGATVSGSNERDAVGTSLN